MKKELTREEVEKTLEEYIGAGFFSAKKAILNDLFGKPFEVGDWVVIGDDNDKSVNKTGEIGKITELENTSCRVDCGHASLANLHLYKNIRHATHEEIAEATWEEGKPYRVRIDDKDEWLVRISSNKVGKFYRSACFSGSTHSWNQYEKL